jgi:transposase
MNSAVPPDASPSTGPPYLPTPMPLPDDVATLQSMIVELLAAVRARDQELHHVRHRLNLLLQRLYGPRGERFDPAQLLLFADAAGDQGQEAAPSPASTATAATEVPPRRRCRPHGRRRLPADLPREARHHELTAAARLCPGCGRQRVDIGVDKSEQLEYRPATLFVIEHWVHKYACPCCSSAPQPQPGPDPASAAVLESPEGLPPEGALEAPAPVTFPEPSPSMPPGHEPPRDEAAGGATPAEQPARPPGPVRPGGRVVSAVKPPLPIAKGLPGAGLLAHLIVSKYVDHLPLYRLERIYERQGVFLPRSTTCDWLAACGQLLRPLHDLLVAAVLRSRVIHTDDTPVKMHDPPPESPKTGRLWVYLGDREHPYNVFDFTPDRKRDGPQRFLSGFAGYLQADAFSGYDGLYLPEPVSGVSRIVEVACNAHARRKFYEARTSDAARSHLALAYYLRLYELERAAKKLDFAEGQIQQMRQDLAVPILEQFRAWLDGQRAEVLPKSPLGEALGYALNNWSALVRYTESGILAIDNNVAEREMKRVAIGRKNWLFVGSLKGGQTAAVLFSFTSTCQRLGVEPWSYLQDVLSRLPTTAAEQLAELLPDRWQAARPVRATPPATPAEPGTLPAIDSPP